MPSNRPGRSLLLSSSPNGAPLMPAWALPNLAALLALCSLVQRPDPSNCNRRFGVSHGDSVEVRNLHRNSLMYIFVVGPFPISVSAARRLASDRPEKLTANIHVAIVERFFR